MSELAREYGVLPEATEESKYLSEQLSRLHIIFDYLINMSNEINGDPSSDEQDTSNTSNPCQNL
ncbi:hypothetical protein [Halopenitus persicus]|uniref:hypothetical protein n=1 Tax=Halopenitus persicus TaxID=1048396 RepID=UPI0011607BD3|nr:hypothetical protein [Halopenitus persicus]